MSMNIKGISGTSANVLIISITVFGVIFGGIIINSMLSDVESPIIIKNCKSANPYNDGAFFECVKLKTGDEKKAADLINRIYSKGSIGSDDKYLSPSQDEQPVGCFDYDGGLNYNIKSNTRMVLSNGSNMDYFDYCDGNELVEGYCINQSSGAINHFDCQNGCFEGICKN